MFLFRCHGLWGPVHRYGWVYQFSFVDSIILLSYVHCLFLPILVHALINVPFLILSLFPCIYWSGVEHNLSCLLMYCFCANIGRADSVACCLDILFNIILPVSASDCCFLLTIIIIIIIIIIITGILFHSFTSQCRVQCPWALVRSWSQRVTVIIIVLLLLRSYFTCHYYRYYYAYLESILC